MKPIAEQIVQSMNNQAIDVLYNKLEVIEDNFINGLISYMDYSSSKDDIINDIHSILSVWLCDVTKFVFDGKFPKRIHFKTLNN
jgi:hypothetical protein